ncbi:MAG: hypothetical protein RIS70_1854, partial [Planctomycetota bacterium]
HLAVPPEPELTDLGGTAASRITKQLARLPCQNHGEHASCHLTVDSRSTLSPDSDWDMLRQFVLRWCDQTLSGEPAFLRLEASEKQTHLAVPPKQTT